MSSNKKLELTCLQVFGDQNTTGDTCDEDYISAMTFDKSGIF